MLQIGRTIVSLDIIQKEFCCDLNKCKGTCCVEGDSGAPITKDEAEIIEKLYPDFGEYLSDHNRDQIKIQGFSVVDNDGELVTPIVGKNECVFTFIDNEGVTKCAIEQAWFEKNTTFRKPISCHLSPIRVTGYKRFDAVNYQELDICKPGRICGESKRMLLWKYLEEPLIRKYGPEWYRELTYAAENLPDRLKG
jgi:hypothetical protein